MEGPWFWGTMDLTLFTWNARFDPMREIIHTLVLWVKIPHLPSEFWEPKIFKIIGDSLGTFPAISLDTKKKTIILVSTTSMEINNA